MRSFSFLTGAAASCLALASLASTAVEARDMSHVVKFQRRDPATSKYPPSMKTPPRSSLPKAWTDSLEALVAAGKIPDIPVATLNAADGEPRYPGKLGLDDKLVCSWTVTNCFGANDLHTPNASDWVISFDDGPTGASTGLYDFLEQHNQPSTHFMIGSQILAYQDAALHAAQTQGQLAVHTWSHSLQSTKNNYEILGEIGWTMQIIYDLTGRVPNVWRPPQGDIDNRVRAVVEGVFNMRAVMWDAECNDWCMQDDGSSGCPGEVPGKNQATIVSAINKALAQPKSPGVMLLEHELNKYTVGFFETYFPTLAGRGWTPKNVADAFSTPWYHNAASNSDTPINVTSMVYSDIQKAVAASPNGSVKAVTAGASGSSTNSSAANATSESSHQSGASSVSLSMSSAFSLAAMGTMAVFAALL